MRLVVCMSTYVQQVIYSTHFQPSNQQWLSLWYTLIVWNPHMHKGPPQIEQIFYGLLLRIINVTLPPCARPNILTPLWHLLLIVWPCSTHPYDAAQEVTTYSWNQTTILIVIDLCTVGFAIGRVKWGNTWGIIDIAVGTFIRQFLWIQTCWTIIRCIQLIHQL